MPLFSSVRHFFDHLSDPFKYYAGDPDAHEQAADASQDTLKENGPANIKRRRINDRLKEEFYEDKPSIFNSPRIGFVLLVIILLMIAFTTDQAIFFND